MRYLIIAICFLIYINSYAQKTPGVYISEYDGFQNYVIEAQTIPAFIGITQNTPNKPGEFTPTLIESIQDYETLFGSFKPYKYLVKVNQKENSSRLEIVELSKDIAAEKAIMYYALKLYFLNGGGSCYIVPLTENSGKENYKKALQEISKYDEVSIIVCPDAIYLGADYYEVCEAAISQCSLLKDRFAIFDVLNVPDGHSVSEFRNNVDGDLKYGAAYMPYLNTSMYYGYDESKVDIQLVDSLASSLFNTYRLNSIEESKNGLYNFVKSELRKNTVILPPSAAIAGVFAKTDRDFGVWKSSSDVVIRGGVSPTYSFSDSEEVDLKLDIKSGKSINAIRSFPGEGILAREALTLAGNNDQWRNISVRRMCNKIKKSAKNSTDYYVFKDNNNKTWEEIEVSINSYLYGLWTEGAFSGSTQEQSFYVNVGVGKSMTAEDVLAGRMIVEIGIAPVHPAEFIIIRFECLRP